MHRRLHVHLGTIGFDHHQAGILEELLGIDPRLLGARLLDRGRRRRLVARLFLKWLFVPRRLCLPMRFFVPRLFCARLELVDAPLLLGQGGGCRRMVFARTIRAIAAITTLAAIAVAATAIAASPAVLFAFALRTRTLTLNLRLLALGRELVELRRFATC